MPLNTTPIDQSKYEPIELDVRMVSAPPTSPEPGMSSFLRAPMPPINSGPDNQRQFFYKDIPQYRIIPPPSNPTNISQTVNTTTQVRTNITNTTNLLSIGSTYILLTSTQTPVFDGSKLSQAGGTFEMPMTAGNITSMTWNNLVKGATYNLRLTSVIGHTVAWAGIDTSMPVVDQGQASGVFQVTFFARTSSSVSTLTPGIMI